MRTHQPDLILEDFWHVSQADATDCCVHVQQRDAATKLEAALEVEKLRSMSDQRDKARMLDICPLTGRQYGGRERDPLTPAAAD